MPHQQHYRLQDHVGCIIMIALLYYCIVLHLYYFAAESSAAPSSAYVYMKPGTTTGELVYRHLDNNSNIIMDFSAVGYGGGDKAIPFVKAKRFLSPINGTEDDKPRIQAALDEVGLMPPDVNGFRGAVVLDKGIFRIESNIHMVHDGVVLRGQGIIRMFHYIVVSRTHSYQSSSDAIPIVMRLQWHHIS